MRLSFEEKMNKAEGKRKGRVKDEVIRSALVEDDDVLALREEKRKLVLEEKRLKALRDGLKSDANLQRKKDRLAEETRQRSALFCRHVPLPSLSLAGPRPHAALCRERFSLSAWGLPTIRLLRVRGRAGPGGGRAGALQAVTRPDLGGQAAAGAGGA